MKTYKQTILFAFIFISFLSFLKGVPEQAESWKKWLKDVESIITNAEKSVFKSLKTEEDRMNFINLSGKSGIPIPKHVKMSISWITTSGSITQIENWVEREVIEEEYT